MFSHFNQKFTIYRDNFKVGSGTQVEVVNLHKVVKGEKMQITATVKLTANVHISGASCSVCKKKAPTLDDDAMWYIIENHDGDRFVFPDGEHAFDHAERDTYPITGWTRGGAYPELTCDTCSVAIDTAVEEAKAKIAKGVDNT